MDDDVSVKLYADITKLFQGAMEKDTQIKAIRKNADEGKATMHDVHVFTRRTAEHASQALQDVLVPENLPDGRIYWNIAQSTIKPLLKEVHTLVLDMAVQVQRALDKKQGIGLKPIRPKFPEGRIDQLIAKIDIVEKEVADVHGEG